MQIHQLKRKSAYRKSRQVGRGGKRGKTSGRGTKGQKARAGRKMRPELRDQIKKIPKLRGYRFHSFQVKPKVINLAVLDKAFAAGDKVTLETLAAKYLVSRRSGVKQKVKILGTGQISKPLKLSGLSYSASVKEKVEKVGGTLE